MPNDRAGFALGKKAPIPDRKALPFGTFLKVVPDHPLYVDNSTDDIVFRMDLNDRVGDCVVAGWDHFRQIVSRLLTGTGLVFSDSQIIEFYKTQNPGFDINGSSRTNGPGSNEDQGMVIQYFLEYLQRNGWILGFARVDINNLEELKAAIYLGLGIIIGINLQTAQQRQTVWDYSPSSEWGGHCVTWDGYSQRFVCVTWGTEVEMTPLFIQKQCDEAWFVLMQDHIDHPEFREGFDLRKFANAFTALTDRDFPVYIPPPVDPVMAADLELVEAGDKWKAHVWSKFTRAGKLKLALENWKKAHKY